MTYIKIIIFILMAVIVWSVLQLIEQKPQNQDNNTAATNQEIQNQPQAPQFISYTNSDLGVEILYRDDMKVEESENQVHFLLLGKTQTEGTELYDGIGFNIRKTVYVGTIEGFVNQAMIEDSQLGHIIEPLNQGTVDGKLAYEYTVNAHGVFRNIFIPINNSEVLIVSYLNPDPYKQGYEQITSQMLQSLKITAR